MPLVFGKQEYIQMFRLHKKEKEGENYLETNQKTKGYLEFCGNFKGKVKLRKGQVMLLAFTPNSYFSFVKSVILCRTVISSVCDLCNDMKQMAEPHFDGTVDKSVQNKECKVYTIYRTWYSTQYNI